MTTSSPKLRLIPKSYDCPAWCERTDHDADDDEFGRYHYGPAFGPMVNTMAEHGSEPFAHHAGDQCNELTAADLRQIAAEALAAAEWLESHR